MLLKGVIMSEKEKTLPPFERAKENVRIMSDNINFFKSVMLLVESINAFDQLDEKEKREMEILVDSTVEVLSLYVEEGNGSWN